MNSSLDNNIFKIISEEADAMHIDAYVIGGYVRDYFLQRPSSDIDIVAVGDGVELASRVGKLLNVKVTVFKTFGTASFTSGGFQWEFVGARKESYNFNSRKPVVETGTLEDDQRRRDFTINALAFSLNKDSWGELLDPFGGIQDMNNGIIRTPLAPDATFSDDPLRMMRAVRFATQLGFTIEKETADAIVRNAHRLEIISGERIITEVEKIMISSRPAYGIDLLDKTGLLKEFFPELTAMKGVERRGKLAHKDNFIHTLGVLRQLSEKSDKLYLRWAALLHDIGKPASKRFDEKTGFSFHGHEIIGSRMIPKIFRRLKLPMDERMKYVQKLVSLHLRPIILSEDIVTDSAVRRLLFEAGDDIDDLMMLCEADITSANSEKVKRLLANFAIVRQKLIEIEKKDHIRNFNPPITGEIIMSRYNIPPCKIIGDIKSVIKDAILDGKIPNEYDAAYALMEELAKKYGLS